MEKYWIALQNIPPGGKTLLLDNQDIWHEPLREFSLDCRIIEPLTAQVSILPQAEGVLFRGQIAGKVALPCDRCASDAVFTIKETFDSFEPFPANVLPVRQNVGPGKEGKRKDGSIKRPEPDVEDSVLLEIDEAVIRNSSHGNGIEVNPAALVWEEFALALPVKPLCGADCKGLCPACGANRNTEACDCAPGMGDSRLAVLRGLTINKK